MSKATSLQVSRVANNDLVERLLSVLRDAGDQPLKVKEVAEKMHVSANTAGKYVEICEARGLVKTDHYGSVKRVWLAPSERKGRVS